MSRIPRLLPLVAIAIGGVLAVKALTEAPQLYLATRALAEDVVTKAAKPALPPGASILSGSGQSNAAGAKPAAPVCAPTAAELAKEAGLSPAELQVLQSLSDRRGQLDQRESGLDVQVQLIAAAEAKLDARIAQMNGLKTDIQGLLGQADQQAQAEADRLVRVYEDMPEKKAAASMAVLDDSVRLPIAAKMKERKLAAILAQMTPQDAKALTEKLAQRTAGSKLLADAKTALNPGAAPTPTPAPAAANATPAAAGPAPDQNAQVSQTPSDKADAPAKPRKVARAAKPKPKPKPAAVDPAVADAMHPPGGVTLPTAKAPAKVAAGPAPAPRPAVKPAAKVAAAGPNPAPTPKPVAPPLPPTAKPG